MAVVETNRKGRVLEVIMNRPEVGNAFDAEVIASMRRLFEVEIPGDDGVHLVVLRGAGRHFCTGADLKWMKAQAGLGRAGNIASAEDMAGLFKAIDRCPKPVLGLIQGAVRGGGLGIVAALDIPIAVEGATFALTEVRLGLAPAVISPFVVGKIGVGRARELFLTGEVFGAAQAEAWGLVHHVVDEASAEARLEERVALLLKGAPQALGACKALAQNILTMDGDEATAYTAELIADLRAGDEAQEGMRAFLSKEKPAWIES